MSLIEIGLILFLFAIAVIVSHNHGYDNGYKEGKQNGAVEMWERLAKTKNQDMS